MLTAKDIMTTEVQTVAQDADLKVLAALFSEKGYDAFPVLDEAGALIGLVTETDLVEQDVPLHIPTVISVFDWVLYVESEKKFVEQVQRISARTVAEICQRDLVTCAPEAQVSHIAELMVDNKVHLICVVDEGELVGVVARLDIIRSLRK